MTSVAPAGRVALVLGTSTGGVGVHVASLVRHLVAAGRPVTVCGPAATDRLFGFAAAGARFSEVPIGGLSSSLRALAPLRRATADADLVHAHGLRAGAMSVLAAGRSKPVVVTLHNAVLEAGVAKAASSITEVVVARGATISIAASPDLQARSLSLGSKDARFLPVGAPPPMVERDAAAVRAELGVPSDRAFVVCVARLHQQKGLDILISSAAKWQAAGVEVTVVIAGDGPLLADLGRQIEQLHAPVRLLGRRSDVPDLLGAADLVVLPSRWEARSLAAQEALQLGRPLLATDTGGMRELVGGAAELVRPDDLAAFTSAGERLLTTPTRLAELATLGAERAQIWPSEADTATAIDAVYRELLGR